MREKARLGHNKVGDLPRDSVVTIAYDNEESIHQNDAFAEHKAIIAGKKGIARIQQDEPAAGIICYLIHQASQRKHKDESLVRYFMRSSEHLS